jgi:hypothetical protein
VAFSSNYWQITASYVQGNAQRKAWPQPQTGAEMPPPFVPETPRSLADVAPLKTPPQTKMMETDAPTGASAQLNRQAMQLWQMSPNLTMDQLKAILQVKRFDQI